MIKMCLVNFPEYLEKQFLDWQHQQGKRKTIEDFAEFLGVSRPLLNMWMNGNRKPGKENIDLLSRTLGNDVYDIAGLPRPNPYLQKINLIFENLSEDHQRQLAEDAELYKIENNEKRLQKAQKQRKKT